MTTSATMLINADIVEEEIDIRLRADMAARGPISVDDIVQEVLDRYPQLTVTNVQSQWSRECIRDYVHQRIDILYGMDYPVPTLLGLFTVEEEMDSTPEQRRNRGRAAIAHANERGGSRQ